MYKLLTKSLDRKKNQDIPRLSQDEHSIERQKDQTYFENVDEVDSYWRGLWETEAKGNLDERSRTVWVRQEEEITRKVEVSVDEVIRCN